eukprot:gene3800-biopygen6787
MVADSWPSHLRSIVKSTGLDECKVPLACSPLCAGRRHCRVRLPHPGARIRAMTKMPPVAALCLTFSFAAAAVAEPPSPAAVNCTALTNYSGGSESIRGMRTGNVAETSLCSETDPSA